MILKDRILFSYSKYSKDDLYQVNYEIVELGLRYCSGQEIKEAKKYEGIPSIGGVESR
jgi:hypothetical protein